MKPKILSPHLMFHEVASKGMPLHLTCTHHNRKTLCTITYIYGENHAVACTLFTPVLDFFPGQMSPLVNVDNIVTAIYLRQI